MRRSALHRIPGPLAACAILLLLAVPSVPAQQDDMLRPGRMGIAIADPTTEGFWDGTWVWTSRDTRFALWIRSDEKGVPEARFRYHRLLGDEAFETDWSTVSDYGVPGTSGRFEIVWKSKDKDRMTGNWTWKVDSKERTVVETAGITMYRSGIGRQITCIFEGLKRTVRRGEAVHEIEYPQVWTFRKVSNRHARWEELPF